MLKKLVIAAVLCVMALGLARTAMADDAGKTKTVTVTGMGTDETAALRDAQRKAVEDGAGTYIASESKTKDFALVRDTVVAKAAGFVKNIEKISSRQMEDKTWEVKIRAEVSVQGIVDAWATVKTYLQQVGRPKIMVWINEKIGAEVIEDSIVQARVEQMLLDSGFLLVDKDRVKQLADKEKGFANLEDKPEKLIALMKQEKAQIFMTGTAVATQGDRSNDDGMSIFTYEAQANIRCYNADTGDLIYKVPGKPTRGVQRVWRSAAQQALKFQADQIAPQMQMAILEHWQEWLSGSGQLEFQVENISFKGYVKLKKALSGLKEFKDVSVAYNNKLATCSIQSDMRAEQLAEEIIKVFEDIEISDVSARTIKAKYTGKD